jgi:hypothetical protein
MMNTVLHPSLYETLAALPLKYLGQAYPNYLAHVLNSDDDILSPQALHPVFYGCYDWHSAVHGFWLLAMIRGKMPHSSQVPAIDACFEAHFTEANMAQELAYFQTPGRGHVERLYGWAWLLKLAATLGDAQLQASWPKAVVYAAMINPLAAYFRDQIVLFVPKQSYPVRSGAHHNTAFAYLLCYEYAQSQADVVLMDSIKKSALGFFQEDIAYPIHYEPSGDEFLSPALCEAALMANLLSSEAYHAWLAAFLPGLLDGSLVLEPALASDRSDAKIGHLDGLNFSRAWCLGRIAQALPAHHAVQETLRNQAKTHRAASFSALNQGRYMGDHWLASFAFLAEEAV